MRQASYGARRQGAACGGRHWQRALRNGPGASAAGNRGDDADFVSIQERSLLVLQKADVFLIDVHVDETAHGAVFIQQPLLDARIARLQLRDGGADVPGGDFDNFLIVGQLSQGRRNSYFGCHNQMLTVVLLSASSSASNSRKLGRISRMRPAWPVTASSVFSPLPVMQSTAASLAEIFPEAISFLATPTVTPPAVSAKMPSVSASSLIASRISSSVTSSAALAVSFITLKA